MPSRRLVVFSRVLVIGKLFFIVVDRANDRLRHLEEVDILRHLSVRPHPHVIKFEDAWEQNRQLFIQTELCLGSLAFFLLEYGSVVERLDEARVWKIVRELSDVSTPSCCMRKY
jgi:mitosis inhibitor protein kinase SWE1